MAARRKPLDSLVGAAGFELATLSSQSWREPLENSGFSVKPGPKIPNPGNPGAPKCKTPKGVWLAAAFAAGVMLWLALAVVGGWIAGALG